MPGKRGAGRFSPTPGLSGDRPQERPNPAQERATRKNEQGVVKKAAAKSSIFVPNALITKPKPVARPKAKFAPRRAAPLSAAQVREKDLGIANDRRAFSLGIKRRPGAKADIDLSKQPLQEITPVKKKQSRLGALLSGVKKVANPANQIRFAEDAARNWASGLDATPHAFSSNTKKFLTWYTSAKPGHGPFGRLSEVAYQTAQGKDTKALYDPRIPIGAAVLDAVNLGSGPETQKFLLDKFGGDQPREREGFHWSTGLEMATALPYLRGARGILEGAKVLRAGGQVEKAIAYANDAFAHSQPIRETFTAVGRGVGKTGPQRLFAVNGLTEAIDRAESRTGRVVEDVTDALRTRTSTQKRVGKNIKARQLTRQRVYERGLPGVRRALRQIANGKNGDFEVAALRFALEADDPMSGAGYHLAQSVREGVSPEESARHAIWSNLSTGAGQIVQVTPEGVVFSKQASPALKEAYRLISGTTSQTRERFLKELGLVTDEQILQRAQAATRVRHGAEWTPYEQILQQTRDANPARQQFHQALIEDGRTPEQADAIVAAIDAVHQSFIQANPGIQPQQIIDGVDQAWSNMLLHVHEGDQIDPKFFDQQLGLDTPDQIPTNVLLREMSAPVDADVKAEYAKKARAVLRRYDAKDLPEGARTPAKMRDLLLELRQRAIQGELYRRWYAVSAQAILKDAGGDPEKAIREAMVFSILSPRAAVWDPSEWNNTTRALAAIHDFDSGLPIDPSLAINEWQIPAIEAALRDGVWTGKGRKTTGFAQNFVKYIDPKRAEEIFGPEDRGTIDTWMRRAFRYEPKPTGAEPISNKMYTFMEDISRDIGQDLGWNTDEAQAAIWTSIKSETEGAPLDQGGVSFGEAIDDVRGQQQARYHTRQLNLNDEDFSRMLDQGRIRPADTGGNPTQAHYEDMLRKFVAEAMLKTTKGGQGKPRLTDRQLEDFIRRANRFFDENPDDPRVTAWDTLVERARGGQSDIPFHSEAADNFDEAAHAWLNQGPKGLDRFDSAARVAQAQGGGTFLYKDGEIVDGGVTDGFMVSRSGAEEKIPADQFNGTTLRDYALTHSDMLDEPGAYLGVWEDNGTVYLDVSHHFDDRVQAERFGREHDQLAIYDVANGESIDLASREAQDGGLMDAIESQPPIENVNDKLEQDVRDNLDALTLIIGNDAVQEMHQLVDEGRYHDLWQMNKKLWRENGSVAGPAAPFFRSVEHSIDDVIRHGIETAKKNVGDGLDNIGKLAGDTQWGDEVAALLRQTPDHQVGSIVDGILENLPDVEETSDLRKALSDYADSRVAAGDIGKTDMTQFENAPVLGETDMSAFEEALKAGDAKVLTIEEALAMGENPDFVFHGTSKAAAEQIMRDRTLRNVKGDYAYLAGNPKVAAQYGRSTALAAGETEADTRIIAIPRDKLPSTIRVSHKGGEYGGEIIRSQDDIHFHERLRKIMGAIEFRDNGQIVIHKAEAAGMLTIVHEVGHLLRSRLTPRQQKSIAKLAGAKKLADGTYEWTREAEEKFADMFVAAIMGRSVGSKRINVPPAMKPAAKVMRKALREEVNRMEVMTLSPKAARAFDKFMDVDPLKGGRFVGAEDVFADSNLVPIRVGYTRGLPVPLNESAVARAIGHYQGLFTGGHVAIGRGPVDPTIEKQFKAALLASGEFANDMSKSVSDVVIASRMKAAAVLRREFLQSASPIPTSTRDQAMKIEPGKDTPAELRKLYDVMTGLDENLEIPPEALDGLNLEAALGMSADMFPGVLDGQSAEEIAAHVLETQKPIDNIVWVPWHVIHSSEVLRTPSAPLFNAAKGGTDALANAAVITAKGLNDIGRAMLTTLNPAYIPMNLTGNLTMALIHQGVQAPRNIFKAAMLHREMLPEDRVLIDTLMGTGFADNIGFQQFNALKTYSHYVGLAVDLIPRRSAFLYEARQAGLDTPQKLAAMLHRTDEEAIDTLHRIAEKAKAAMVDFDKMGATEKKIGQWILFYPWIRGATAYTAKLAMDHPLLFATLIALHDNAQAQAQAELGDRPGYAKESYPIGTGSIGLKIPFTDARVSLADVVGEHTWQNANGLPMTINIRQAFPQTTPAELAQQIKDIFDGKASIIESLPPLVQASIVTAAGYDPFYAKEVDRSFGTFFSQLVGGAPGPTAVGRALQSKESRDEANQYRINPRSRINDILRIGGGSLTPQPYDPEKGQRQAARQEGDTARVTEIDITKEAKAVGLPEPTEKVKEDIRWAQKLSDRASGKSDEEKAQIAAEVFAERFPDRGADVIAMVDALTPDQQKWFYRTVQKYLAPDLGVYKKILTNRKSSTP